MDDVHKGALEGAIEPPARTTGTNYPLGSFIMLRAVMIVIAAGCLLVLPGCSNDSEQSIDVSTFDEFTFSRTIEIGVCFTTGDLISVDLSSQVDNRVFTYTYLTVSTEEEAECLVVTENDECLAESERTTRVLVSSENTKVDRLFKQIEIANEPDELCGAGNVTLCSDDEFMWDGLTVSADFCRPVYAQNGFEIISMLEQLRDGPPQEGEEGSDDGDASFQSQPVEILRIEDIVASDQLLGKNGDFTVVRTQSELDGVLFQDGSISIDFATEIGIAVVIVRGPCQEFTGVQATENLLWIDIHGTMDSTDDCFLDLGSVDAYMIVIPKTSKLIRLFLNNSELDEVNL